MELTLKYYHYFGDSQKELGDNLNTARAWDILRTKKGVEGLYYIPEERELWRQICLSDERLKAQAKDIAELAKKKYDRLYSFGVGAAYLEFLIKQECPSLKLHCSDFTPLGIERLKKVFTEAEEIFRFDMMQGDWKTIVPRSLCLLYRVDTVFDDVQWQKVFRRMSDAGVAEVLFIPSDILTFKKILYLQFKYVIFRLFRWTMTFSGFLRTKSRWMTLLSAAYQVTGVVQVGKLHGFLLKLKGNNG